MEVEEVLRNLIRNVIGVDHRGAMAIHSQGGETTTIAANLSRGDRGQP
jgi:hypothetical protein